MLPVSCQGPERLTVPALLSGRGRRVSRLTSAASSAACASVAVLCAGLGWAGAGLIPRLSTFFSRLASSTTVHKANWIRFVDMLES